MVGTHRLRTRNEILSNPTDLELKCLIDHFRSDKVISENEKFWGKDDPSIGGTST